MEQRQASAGATFKLTMRWPSDDILPVTLEYCSAHEALLQMDARRRRDGMVVVKIEMQDEAGVTAITPTKLREMVYGKPRSRILPRDRYRTKRNNSAP